MKISIFGLGYVGLVTAAVLARQGHHVIGVEKSSEKVALVNTGHSVIHEPGLEAILKETVANGNLICTDDAHDAVLNTDLSFICVGTPSSDNGDVDLRDIRKVCVEIGHALQFKEQFHSIVQRSTVLPGTIAEILVPILEKSSAKKVGKEFGIGSNPEFLREGLAVEDFLNPSRVVIGELDQRTGEAIARLYEGLDTPVLRTDVKTAELVKYIDNVWHALKVGFGNEVGSVCKRLAVDSHELMDIFCADTKLNMSPAYLRPGFCFGGSCLPKDVRALNHKIKDLGVRSPLINSVLSSNEAHFERTFDAIVEMGCQKIGILGLTFKAGTDDLRESPLLQLAERLLDVGYEVKIYEPNLNRARLVELLPFDPDVVVGSLDDLLSHGEIIVIGNANPEFKSVFERCHSTQQIFDLVRLDGVSECGSNYQGLCW